jgi:hypothetical protein
MMLFWGTGDERPIWEVVVVVVGFVGDLGSSSKVHT